MTDLMTDLGGDVSAWYVDAARDLPWRRPGVSPWAVLVSEVMLQQTTVARVLPAYGAWLTRWPDPHALASDSPGGVVNFISKTGEVEGGSIMASAGLQYGTKRLDGD